jgi:hypothetical protein
MRTSDEIRECIHRLREGEGKMATLERLAEIAEDVAEMEDEITSQAIYEPTDWGSNPFDQ